VSETPMMTDSVGGRVHHVDDENTGRGNMDIDQTMAQQIPTFRHNSLVVATYPWATGIVMSPTLSNAFDENHFGYVS
jgi:hypothetical protein